MILSSLVNIASVKFWWCSWNRTPKLLILHIVIAICLIDQAPSPRSCNYPSRKDVWTSPSVKHVTNYPSLRKPLGVLTSTSRDDTATVPSALRPYIPHLAVIIVPTKLLGLRWSPLQSVRDSSKMMDLQCSTFIRRLVNLELFINN